MPGRFDQGGTVTGGESTTSRPGAGPKFTLDPIRNHPELLNEPGHSYVDAQGNVQTPNPTPGQQALMGQMQHESQLSALIAQQEAERRAREARIAQALSTIDSVFGRRSGVFDRFADETYDLNRDRLTDQRSDTARQLKFALARAGTLGGSADVDKHAELEERYGNELADARSYADDQAARMRAEEESLKSQLSAVASSGNVTGAQAGGMARGALTATEAAMRSPSVRPDLGRSFTGIADIIGQALMAQGLRQGRGMGFGNEYSSFFPGRGNSREEGTIS